MATAPALPGLASHFLTLIGNDLPLHALARLVRGSRHLEKALIK